MEAPASFNHSPQQSSHENRLHSQLDEFDIKKIILETEDENSKINSQEIFKQFDAVATLISEKFSEINKKRISRLLELRKIDLPRFRRQKELIKLHLSSPKDNPPPKYGDREIDEEDVLQLADGIHIDDIRYQRETRLSPELSRGFKNEFVAKEMANLGNVKMVQVRLLVLACLEDVSYFGITCTKPFGVTDLQVGHVGSDHTGFEIYDDKSEDANKLFDHLFDAIPETERSELNRTNGLDDNELQIFPHPFDRTKIILRFDSSFPGGINKYDRGSSGINDQGRYDTRSGSYKSVLVISKSSDLANLLAKGKKMDLINPILRILAVHFNKDAFPVVDGFICSPGSSWDIQNRVNGENKRVDEKGKIIDLTKKSFSTENRKRKGAPYANNEMVIGRKVQDNPVFWKIKLDQLGYPQDKFKLPFKTS